MPINILIQQWTNACANTCIGLVGARRVIALRRERGERRETISHLYDYQPVPQEEGKVILVENTFQPSYSFYNHHLLANPFYSPVQCLSATELTPWPKKLLDKLTIVDLGTIGKFSYELATELNEDKRRQLTSVFNNPAVGIDKIASISIIYDQELINRFLENAPDTLDVIQLNNPFRGGDGSGVAGTCESFKTLNKNVAINTTCLFAYKAKFNTIVNWSAEEPVVEEKELTFLGMFISKENFLRYKRPSEFLTKFRTLVTIEIDKYLDYETYQAELQKQLGRFGAYWTGLQTIAKKDLQGATAPLLPTEFKALNSSELTPILSASAFNNIPEVSEMNSFSQLVKQQQNEANSQREEVKRKEKDKNANEKTIKDYLTYIEECKSEIEKLLREAKEAELKAIGIESVLPEMFEELSKKKALADAKIANQEVFVQEQIGKMVKTLEDTYRIRVTKLRIKDKKTLKTYEINPNSKLELVLDFSIEEIEFITLQPSLIYVDKNADKQRDIRVGGPYRVRWIKNSHLYIKLLDMYSVFGINGTSLKCHPHSTSQYINCKTFKEIKAVLVDEWSSCCWGEAAVPTNKAMEAGNLKLTILNILNWVNNANSADAWGANYIWFPKPSDVNLDPDWNNIQIPEPTVQVTTEENMEDLIAQAIEALDNNNGGV